MKERYRRIYEEFNYQCFFCGKGAKQIHHIHPRCRQGGDNRENLISVCFSCHKQADWLVLKFFLEINRLKCGGCTDVGRGCFKCPNRIQK